MNVYTVIPVMNQREITQQTFDKFREMEGPTKFPVLIIDNGSNPPVREWLQGLRDGDLVVRNEQNVGVRPALNQAYRVLRNMADFIFYTHNDVIMHERNWTDKIVEQLTAHPETGVMGFYGAKGIGTHDIYRAPYSMSQMVRVENVSACNHMNAAVHGFRQPRGIVESVAVMDGFSLIVNVELLNKIGGFDEAYPVHHNYDNDICLESLDKGYTNYVIAMDAEHLGGRTDVGENWAEPFGKTKQQVHQEAHPVMYEKWHPKNVESGLHKISMPVRIQ